MGTSALRSHLKNKYATEWGKHLCSVLEIISSAAGKKQRHAHKCPSQEMSLSKRDGASSGKAEFLDFVTQYFFRVGRSAIVSICLYSSK
jgi:hypothetical protein